MCDSRTIEFDPLAFEGTAEYYSVGRPPYSEKLGEAMRSELSLDGEGQLLDVGCGPGVLELELAVLFERTVALDPEPGMLQEGRRRCEEAGVLNVHWMSGVADDLATLDIGSCRVVTFAKSFHRVHQFDVAEMVYDILEPGGALVLVSNVVDGRTQPVTPGYPPTPHDAIRELIISYLGDGTRRYLATWNEGQPARFENTLAPTRFRGSRTVYAAGRSDLIRDIDTVVAHQFSLSYAAPRLFGELREEFETDLRHLLSDQSPSGLFWDWPGDTELVIATKSENR
jgi:SAM-dependent methyltransferase